MAPLHRNLSFQISGAFNGMLNRTNSQNKFGYYFGDETDSVTNQSWFQKALMKSFSYDCPKNACQLSAYEDLKRAASLPKRFGEINYNVSLNLDFCIASQ